MIESFIPDIMNLVINIIKGVLSIVKSMPIINVWYLEALLIIAFLLTYVLRKFTKVFENLGILFYVIVTSLIFTIFYLISGGIV